MIPRDPSEDRTARQIDMPGIVLLSLTLAIAAFAATRAGHIQPIAALALALLAAGTLAGFVVAERRATAPLVDLSLLRSPRLWPGLAQMALVSMIVMTTLVVGPFYLTGSLGLTAAATGLVMSIGPGVVALAGVPAGRLVDRWGVGPVAGLGLGVTALGTIAMMFLPMALGTPGYAASLAGITAGYALFQSANATAVMAAAPTGARGTASGLLSLSRNVGLIAGASAMGAVFDLGARLAGADAGLKLAFGVAAGAAVAALAMAAQAGIRTEAPG